MLIYDVVLFASAFTATAHFPRDDWVFPADWLSCFFLISRRAAWKTLQRCSKGRALTPCFRVIYCMIFDVCFAHRCVIFLFFCFLCIFCLHLHKKMLNSVLNSLIHSSIHFEVDFTFADFPVYLFRVAVMFSIFSILNSKVTYYSLVNAMSHNTFSSYSNL